MGKQELSALSEAADTILKLKDSISHQLSTGAENSKLGQASFVSSPAPTNVAIMNKVLNELVTANEVGDTSASITVSDATKEKAYDLFEKF